MQGKDPFLALLGLFILSTTFFFCGKGLMTSPSPVALENPTTIPALGSNSIESPLPSASAPPVSAPVELSKTTDEQQIGHPGMNRTNGAPFLPEGEALVSHMPTMLHEDGALGFEHHGHTNNVGLRHDYGVSPEPRASADVEDLLSQKIGIERLPPKGGQVPRLVAERPTAEGRRQNQSIEWFVGAEREQP